MSDKDPALIKAVSLAKRATATRPLFFTLVLKGGTDGALLLSRKKSTTQEIKALKEKCGGSVVVRGRCFMEDGKLTFETAKLPSAAVAKVLKMILRRDAGVSLPVEARLASDLVEEEETPGEESSPVVEDQEAPTSPADAPVGEKKVSNVVFTQARLVWDATRKSVQNQLKQLEQQILTVCQQINNDPNAEIEIDAGELASNVKTIYTILDKLDQRLIDKLDEALNAPVPEQRAARHREAAAILREYQEYVTNDPLFNAIDDNGFVPLTIRKNVLAALHGLASKL